MAKTEISSPVLFQLKVTARNQTFAQHLTLEPNPVQKVTYQSDAATPEIFFFFTRIQLWSQHEFIKNEEK